MPKLNKLIEVGFCKGYGDGDYRISAEVQSLSRNQMSELINTMFHAQRMAWEMWCRGQKPEESLGADIAALAKQEKGA